MYAGIAGGLLVFTGLWHATEWIMDGRRRDTWLLVPVGLIYLALGSLLALSVGGVLVKSVALALVAAGGCVAFLRRNQVDMRRWVAWTFIIVDALIVLALIFGLSG